VALLLRLGEHLKTLDRQVDELETQIQQWHREQAASPKTGRDPRHWPAHGQRLVATIGDARQFESGRQLAAWLGLVPRQHSSGGKPTLLGIGKRGDVYLRTLLIHGARAVVRVTERRVDATDGWLKRLLGRRNQNVAAVALANKNARIVWALLARDRAFRPDDLPTAVGA
jgi:transposase